MSKWWKWFVPGHVWLLPYTLGYAVFCFIVYGARSWGIRNGVLIAIAGTKPDGKTKIWGDPNGQTIGAMTVFDSTIDESKHDELHAHENSHIVEAFWFALVTQIATPVVFAWLGWPLWLGFALGGFMGVPIYSVSYGLSFFVLWAEQGFSDWQTAYRKIPHEELAYYIEDQYMAKTPEQRSQIWT